MNNIHVRKYLTKQFFFLKQYNQNKKIDIICGLEDKSKNRKLNMFTNV